MTGSVSRVGYNMLQSLLEGGFRGRAYPVHPRLEEVMGLKAYHSLADIPDRVDLFHRKKENMDILSNFVVLCKKIFSAFGWGKIRRLKRIENGFAV